MTPLSEADMQRVNALLAGIRDVAPPGHPVPIPLAEASDGHRKAFDQYVAELRRSKETGEEWFNGLVEGIIERTGKGKDEAIRASEASSPLGPTEHAMVIGTIRRNWLRCADLNSAARHEERVPPEQFLLAWLVDSKHVELVKLVSRLTYWPIGLDLKKKDQWV